MALSSKEMSQVNKAVQNFESMSRDYFSDILEDVAIPMIKEIIMSEYDAELVAAVTDRNSRTRPDLYRDDFVDSLNRFEYFEFTMAGLMLRTPDMDNFDFSGRLRIIENILEGTAGIYIEVDEEQYVQMYNRQPRRTDLFNQDEPKKSRIYLLRLNVDVRNRLRTNDIPMIRFPFSNTPSIDIFSAADQLVEANMDNWMDKAVNNARKSFTVRYRS